MARQPLPTETLKLRGTLRKDRRKADEPRPRDRKPACPSWLDAEAKAEWKRLTTELDAMGILRSADRPLLVAYCQAWSQFKTCSEALRKSELTMTTANGTVVQNPVASLIHRAVERMQKIIVQFGLTPAARTRISTGEGGKNDLEEFIDAGRRDVKVDEKPER